MGRSHTSSVRSSVKSSRESTFSKSSRKTDQTDLTSYTNTRPSLKHFDTAPVYKQIFEQKQNQFIDEGLPQSSTASFETYASTEASEEEFPALSLDNFPEERQQCFEPDSIPTTPADFAELYPTGRRIMIQHDDSTFDGNMNIRVDIDVTTRSGRRRKMTLFHLRMQDIAERKFSLRRYHRNSGREVANTKRQYITPMQAKLKTLKPAVKRSCTAPEFQRSVPVRQDSGYVSEEDEEDDFLEKLKQFSIANDIKATVPTDTVRLEFSNYAQVTLEPVSSRQSKRYDFEYWGEQYTWRKRALRDDDEIVNSYELINTLTQEKVASIVPDALSAEETAFEKSQGAWIPACSMRLLQPEISDDLGDVIMATGLLALTDDCVPR